MKAAKGCLMSVAILSGAT